MKKRFQYQSKSSFCQIDSGGLPPEQLQASSLFQVFGSGAWKLGCCMPSECTKEDAAKVKAKHEAEEKAKKEAEAKGYASPPPKWSRRIAVSCSS